MTYLPRRHPHRINDLDIARAAAEIALQRVHDLRIGRIGFAIQQPFGGHQHARRAKAALHRTAFDERNLKGVETGHQTSHSPLS